MAYDSWQLKDIQNRAKKIEDKFFSLYPMPTTTFEPLRKAVEEVSLEDEDFNPINRTLAGYKLFGVEYQQIYWIDMITNVVKELYKRDPDAFEALAQKDYWIHSTLRYDLKKYVKLAENCYLWRHANNHNKLIGLRYIFDELNIAYGDLILYIDPIATSEPSNEAKPAAPQADGE